jgi:hypothetical protein
MFLQHLTGAAAFTMIATITVFGKLQLCPEGARRRIEGIAE